MSYKELQAEAKALGIKSVGVSGDNLKAAILSAQAVVNANPLADPDIEEIKEPVPAVKEKSLYEMTDAELQAKANRVANIKLIEEAEAEKKEKEAEAKVIKDMRSKRMMYQQQEKVKCTVPYDDNQPQIVTVTADGYTIEMIRGVEKSIPRTHFEILEDSLKEKRKNSQNSRRAEAAFLAGKNVTRLEDMRV